MERDVKIVSSSSSGANSFKAFSPVYQASGIEIIQKTIEQLKRAEYMEEMVCQKNIELMNSEKISGFQSLLSEFGLSNFNGMDYFLDMINNKKEQINILKSMISEYTFLERKILSSIN